MAWLLAGTARTVTVVASSAKNGRGPWRGLDRGLFHARPAPVPTG
jgi:hypothetical protein